MKTRTIAILSFFSVMAATMISLAFKREGPPVTDTFSGTYPIHAPVTLKNQKNVSFTHQYFKGSVNHAIDSLNGCDNVTFTDCVFGQPTALGVNNVGLSAINCTNIHVLHCWFENVSTAVYAQASQSIQVEYCQMKNMRGPYPRGQVIQFNNVSGPLNRINFNLAENFSGQSNGEDMLSVYKSHGVPSDPIEVNYNWLRGPGDGPSTTGAGITVGDQGGSYIQCLGNIVVRTNVEGIQCAGGTYIYIVGNKVSSVATARSRQGMGYGNYSSFPTNNVTITANFINWIYGQTVPNYRQDTTRDKTLAKPIGFASNFTVSSVANANNLPTNFLASSPIY